MMKAPLTYSPHEHTMDRKPALGECEEYDEQAQGFYPHQQASPTYHLDVPEGYHGHGRQPEASPTDGSWGSPYSVAGAAAQQDPRAPPEIPPPLYRHGAAMAYSHLMPAYYHGGGNQPWHHPSAAAGPPPHLVMPSIAPAFYAQQQHYGQHQHHQAPQSLSPPGPPPAIYPLDSRGSLSSYDGSDHGGALGGGGGGGGGHASGRPRHPRGRRRGGPRPHPGGVGPAAGGSPPNRGWYRYDDGTTLFQMRGRVVEIAKDRDGSKFVQRRLQVADPAEVAVAFDEAVAGVEELWNDVYGNYILQGLLDLGTDDMRATIGRKLIDGDVVFLSTKVYGCRLIQKALDTLDEEGVANVVLSVKGKVWNLVHDHNGNHVVQKSITKINELLHKRGGHLEEEDDDGEEEPSDDPGRDLLLRGLDVVVDEVLDSVQGMSTHPYGCRVVQRLVEHCVGPPKHRVLDGLAKDGLFDVLVDHEYGNYVVQRVLAYGREVDRAAVFDAVVADVTKLSRQKHSSNVVEMMLTYGDEEQRRRIVDAILTSYCMDQNFANKCAAVSMAEDAYANYVVKTALDVLPEGPQRDQFFAVLLANLEDLEKSQFAKQVVLRAKAYAQREATGE